MPLSPPRPKDLPLNGLRAFEAAARHASFAAAAEELGVSPGAISAHIRQLEQILGDRLFERSARGVRLTPVAVRVLPDFSAAFDRLGEAAQSLRAEAAPRVVHIATLPALAHLWLSPRLPALRREAPEITVSITALEAPPPPRRTPYDLCLFPHESLGNSVAEQVIFPVCAPSLAATLSTPEDLMDVPCLTDTTWRDDWSRWAAQAMPGRQFAPRGPVFSLYALALQETISGAGVLIGHAALVGDALSRGALVEPFGLRIRLRHDLRLWTTRPLRPRSPVRRVAGWLRDSR